MKEKRHIRCTSVVTIFGFFKQGLIDMAYIIKIKGWFTRNSLTHCHNINPIPRNG